ncbi:MAG: S1C family serine protease [Aureliella sp.]
MTYPPKFDSTPGPDDAPTSVGQDSGRPNSDRASTGGMNNAKLFLLFGMMAFVLVIASIAGTILFLTSSFGKGLIANSASQPLPRRPYPEASSDGVASDAASVNSGIGAKDSSNEASASRPGEPRLRGNADSEQKNLDRKPLEPFRFGNLPGGLAQQERDLDAERRQSGNSTDAEVDTHASPLDRNFSYRFQGNEDYFYKYDVVISDTESQGVQSSDRKIEGTIAIKPGDSSEIEFEPQSTGTAFAVTKHHVISCAHVVGNGRRFTLMVDEVEYLARVIQVDHERDLALLEVEGAEFTPLPLASSDELALAEEVYAFGYPLSDLLGENIKVARGIVAGIGREVGKDQITIDGAINPGNSGGPVVNSLGQIVGVATAKISGDTISPVGIASPVAGIHDLLSVAKVLAEEDRESETLPPKAIASRTAPSVFLIKSFPWLDNVVRNVRFTMTQSDTKRQTRRFVNGKEAFGNRSDCILKLSRLGDITDGQESVSIPYLVGKLSRHLFVPLARNGDAKRWNVYREELLEPTPAVVSPFDLLGPRRFPFAPLEEQGQLQPVVAHEQTEFEVVERDERRVEVRKDYRFKVDARDVDETQQLEGIGVWAFDLSQGLPIGIEEKLTYADERKKYQITLRIAPQDPPDDFEWGRDPSQNPMSEIESILQNRLRGMRGF